MPILELVTVCLIAATPFCYLLAMACSLAPVNSRMASWPLTLGLAGAVLVSALLASAITLFAGPSQAFVATFPGIDLEGLAPSVRVDALTLAMLSLIGYIGIVILMYSRRYLAGDPGKVDPRRRMYRRWFSATLASVTTLVITNQLWLLALAWIATSLCLHKLLAYYDQRPQALLAAHKKFLSSRLTDTFILIGVFLIGRHFGTFEINAVFATAAQTPWTVTLTIACALLACAAILKCAQLPFHGWLIQVMEAPTPVSALLHAGIVNIGGFLMIRFAPLMAPATFAQTLLIIAGTTTAVTAGLIMSTRVSIKVMLAWSTCAQMGFMLLECGLGLYGLALLHLLAHSLYKAHSFLTAGEMAAISARRARTPAVGQSVISGFGWGLVSVSAGFLAVVVFIWPQITGGHPAVVVVVIGALATLAGDALGANRLLWRRVIGAGVAIALLYAFWSALFSFLEPTRPPQDIAGAEIGVAIAFAGLFALRAITGNKHGARHLRWLHPHVYGGFYLDQLFTRLTLVIWPPRLRQRPQSTTSPFSAVTPPEPEA